MATIPAICARSGCARPIRIVPGQPRLCAPCKVQLEQEHYCPCGVQGSLDEELRKAKGQEGQSRSSA